MRLLLCERTDLAALWAYRGLRARGCELELVSSEVLARALGWEHRLGVDGSSIRIELASGHTIDGAEVDGVLNRLVRFPVEHLTRASDADREYAAQEFHALFLSWLHTLRGPILNRPSPHGLAGPWLHPSEWLVLAAEAGLPTVGYARSSARAARSVDEETVEAGPPAGGRTVLMVAGTPTVALSPRLAEGCRLLAELAQTELLGVHFAASSSTGWACTGASSLPDLRVGSVIGLDLLAAALRGEAPTPS